MIAAIHPDRLLPVPFARRFVARQWPAGAGCATVAPVLSRNRHPMESTIMPALHEALSRTQATLMSSVHCRGMVQA